MQNWCHTAYYTNDNHANALDPTIDPPAPPTNATFVGAAPDTAPAGACYFVTSRNSLLRKRQSYHATVKL